MHKWQAAGLALCFYLDMASYLPLAAAYNGSVPLLCALVEVFDCQAGSDRQREMAESANLPQFVKVNFAEKTLSTPEPGERTSVRPMTRVDGVDGNMILQGLEGSRARSMVMTQDTGKMTATVSDHQIGFVVFGACLLF
jgi:hypothetical protein